MFHTAMQEHMHEIKYMQACTCCPTVCPTVYYFVCNYPYRTFFCPLHTTTTCTRPGSP